MALVDVPRGLWSALRHGDVRADGLVLREPGKSSVLGYLQPSGRLLDELLAYRGEVPRPASTLGSDPHLSLLELQVGPGLVPGLSIGGLASVAKLREPRVDQIIRNDLTVAIARASANPDDELAVMYRLFHHGGEDVNWRMMCARARIETALATNRGEIARDACADACQWLLARHPAHVRTMRDAAALCSLLLARGIDTRDFLEEIRQHPRAELLLAEAI